MINSEETHAVSSGPLEQEPVELGRALSDGFDPAVSGEEIEHRTAKGGERSSLSLSRLAPLSPECVETSAVAATARPPGEIGGVYVVRLALASTAGGGLVLEPSAQFLGVTLGVVGRAAVRRRVALGWSGRRARSRR